MKKMQEVYSIHHIPKSVFQSFIPIDRATRELQDWYIQRRIYELERLLQKSSTSDEDRKELKRELYQIFEGTVPKHYDLATMQTVVESLREKGRR